MQQIRGSKNTAMQKRGMLRTSAFGAFLCFASVISYSISLSLYLLPEPSDISIL